MKSSIESLNKRGLVTENNLVDGENLTTEQIRKELNSEYAEKRSAAVILLRTKCSVSDEKYIRLLLEMLKVEPALYTRIELCNSLEKGNELTAEIMCEYLGAIGDNQHKMVTDAVSKKKCFPLPRDMIARTMGKMDKSVINVLIRHLDIEDRQKISELLDAIGYMIFYHSELATIHYFNHISDTVKRFKSDDLIVWKAAKCCSAFPLIQCKELLEQIKEMTTSQTIQSEVERSLRFIDKKMKNN